MRRKGWPLGITIALLLLLHFYVRPRLYDGPGAPDFLLLALLIIALRTSPGVAAVAGFLVGFVTDVLTPVRIGAGALAHTVVAALAAWGRTVLFPEHARMNAMVFGVCTLLRNLLLAVATDPSLGAAASAFGTASLAQAVTTAAVGGLISLAIRHRVDLRYEA